MINEIDSYTWPFDPS